MAELQTNDPDTVIEEKHEGYVRYRRLSTGERWEVSGVCDRRGDCLIGSVIDTPNGPVQIKDHAHIDELKLLLGKERLDSEMDVPVTAGFTGCCPLEITVL